MNNNILIVDVRVERVDWVLKKVFCAFDTSKGYPSYLGQFNAPHRTKDEELQRFVKMMESEENTDMSGLLRN